MTQNIVIEIPKGKVAKQVTNPDGSISITFVDKEPIRSKSWEEFCENHPDANNEWYINPLGKVLESNSSLTNLRRVNANLSTKEDAEGILALIQLTRLHDEWVGDWKGTYIAQYAGDLKYQITCSEDEPCVLFHHVEHSLLDFPTKELATEFLECFKDLIEKAKKFI